MGRTGGTFISIVVVAIIVLACLLYLAAATSGSGKSELQLQVAGPINYMSVGSGNVLYIFSGTDLTAVNPDGEVKWALNVSNYLNTTEMSPPIFPIYAEDQGNLYLCVAGLDRRINEGKIVVYDTDGTIVESNLRNFTYNTLAISPSGQIRWVYSSACRPSVRDENPAITAASGRIYLYAGGQETVLDDNGNLLFNITDILCQAAVDETGCLYVVPTGNKTTYSWKSENYSGSTSDLFPSRAIDAYGPDGTLLWHKELDDYVHMPYRLSMPQYRNGMVYLLTGDRVVAMDRDSNEVWSYDFNAEDIRLNLNMQLDATGNMYVDVGSERLRSYPHSYAVNVGNRSVTEAKIPSTLFSYEYLGYVQLYTYLINGICYQANITDIARVQPTGRPWLPGDYKPGWKELEDINDIIITATDVMTGDTPWSFHVPSGDAKTVINSESNVSPIFARALEDLSARGQNLSNVLPSIYVDQNSTPICSVSSVGIYPGNNVTYVSVNDVNFQPIVYNQSKCHYINGIYALNETGGLLWYRPVDDRIEKAAIVNGTIYYSTGGGKIFSGGNGVVSGVAILGTLYMFLRFLMIGAVSRTRSRLEHNENRNRVYGCIADNPGLTLYDISRDLRMNVGTARYHLMVLGINHRIVTQKAFGKYTCYFTNSGSHSPNNQLLYSALRRPGIKNILGLLVERPGLSNREIAGQLNMQESAASRYMKELASTGLVERRNKAEGRHVYYINEQYEEALASTMKTNAGKMSE